MTSDKGKHRERIEAPSESAKDDDAVMSFEELLDAEGVGADEPTVMEDARAKALHLIGLMEADHAAAEAASYGVGLVDVARLREQLVERAQELDEKLALIGPFLYPRFKTEIEAIEANARSFTTETTSAPKVTRVAADRIGEALYNLRAFAETGLVDEDDTMS